MQGGDVGVDVESHGGAYAQLNKGVCLEPNGGANVLLRGVSTSTAPSPSLASITHSASLNSSSNLYITSQITHGDNIPSFIPPAVTSPSHMRISVCPTNPRTLAVPLSTFLYQPIRTPLLSLEVTNAQRGLDGLTPAPTTHPMLNTPSPPSLPSSSSHVSPVSPPGVNPVTEWAICFHRPKDPSHAPGIIISPRARPSPDVIRLRQAIDLKAPAPVANTSHCHSGTETTGTINLTNGFGRMDLLC